MLRNYCSYSRRCGRIIIIAQWQRYTLIITLMRCFCSIFINLSQCRCVGGYPLWTRDQAVIARFLASPFSKRTTCWVNAEKRCFLFLGELLFTIDATLSTESANRTLLLIICTRPYFSRMEVREHWKSARVCPPIKWCPIARTSFSRDSKMLLLFNPPCRWLCASNLSIISHFTVIESISPSFPLPFTAAGCSEQARNW